MQHQKDGSVIHVPPKQTYNWHPEQMPSHGATVPLIHVGSEMSIGGQCVLGLLLVRQILRGGGCIWITQALLDLMAASKLHMSQYPL